MTVSKSKQLWATAYHEAGHAVAAIQLRVGIGSRGVNIVSSEGAAGTCHILKSFSGSPELETTGRMRLGAEKMAIILFAGPVAQRTFRPSSLRNYHGHSDRKRAIGLMECFVGSNRELEAYLNYLRIRAEQLVVNPLTWKTIEAVAIALFERKRLTAQEVKDIRLAYLFPDGIPRLPI
jgi:hypothetical protein